jgi:RimJ/RimL family protein N-acetyltransferase
VVFSVLEGSQPGRVFVDGRDEPRSALVWGVGNDCCLAGAATNDAFNAALVHLLRGQVMPVTEHLLLYSYAEAWRVALDELLAEDGVQRVARTVFDWHPARSRALFRARHGDWHSRIPAEHRVERLDATTAAQVEGMAELWGSIDAFLAGGFGYGVLAGGALLSNCQTVFIGDSTAEIGVHTDDAHRRRGLATLAACACLEHCLESGIRPAWGCFYNAASGGLAEKLGFVNRRDVEVNYVHVPA